MQRLKQRYRIDTANRLIIRRPDQEIKTSGEFFVNQKNQLVYRINQPQAWRKENNLAPKIVFNGKWSLDKNHDLQLSLEKNRDQSENDILILSGEIISAAADQLNFAIKSYDVDGLLKVRILKLSGRWLADECNRLNFELTRLSSPETLIFEAGWKLNKNQEIIYKYERVVLKRKTREQNSFILKGYWQINDNKRISYALAGGENSILEFRVCLQTPSIRAKEGALRYLIGIGIKENKAQDLQVLCLYGSWKINKKLGLDFEIDYGRQNFRQIEFGADLELTKDSQISFKLRTLDAKPLGLSVLYTRELLKGIDAKMLLRLKSELGAGYSLDAGLKFPF